MKATDTRPIGRTDLSVTCLGLGGVFLAWDAPRAEAEALIDRAAELGVRYLIPLPCTASARASAGTRLHSRVSTARSS